jgi:hypothetical protein
MMIYVSEAAALLIGGFILPIALRDPRGAREETTIQPKPSPRA